MKPDCSSADQHADRVEQSEAAALSACLNYCAALFSYPTGNSFDCLRQAILAFNEQHLLLADAPLPAPSSLTTLQYEYTSLFAANPAGLPAVPYASCYLDPDGQTCSALSFDLLNMMQAEGVKPLDQSGEPADHIACILAFAALLAATAYKKQNTKALSDLLTKYLDPWIHDFCSNIRSANSSTFYNSAAQFCNNLLMQRAELFPSLFNKGE